MGTSKTIAVLSIVAIFGILYGSGFCVNYPLEIIQPRVGLDMKNRFYRAYPGLEYNVHVAVIGGTYPFTYSLTAAPTGMTVDSNSGQIVWPNPTTDGSPHTAAVSVTDAENNTVSSKWTITVTTTGFYFVDAVNGKHALGLGCSTDCGTGTLANPWKSMIDWYTGTDITAKHDTSYRDGFLYFKAGTYQMEGYIEGDQLQYGLADAPEKPVVWLAYPGDQQPVLDFANAYLYLEGNVDNFYLDGFELNALGRTGGISRAIEISSNSRNVTFRKNKAHGIRGNGGSNPALIFIERDAKGQYWAIINNTAYDNISGYFLLGYSADKVLVADNTIYDTDGIAIGPKLGVTNWFIRHNNIHDCPTDGILVDYYAGSSDIELSFNKILMTGSGVGISIGRDAATPNGPVIAFRNTVVGDVYVNGIDENNDPITFYKNVIINSSTETNHITTSNISAPARVTSTDDLSGDFEAGIVDSNGNLQNAYRAQYLGLRGCEVGEPLPPHKAA